MTRPSQPGDGAVPAAATAQGEFDFSAPAPAEAAPAAGVDQFGEIAADEQASSSAVGLYLQSLAVSQLRQFRAPLQVTGLQPGLNVIAGPNESGKSTLARALRAAFFERHRSKSVEDLRPLGDSAAMPSVDLVFALHGETAQLHKSFLASGAHCELQWGREHWSGAQAEEQLAQWLGYQYAKKGASRSEHWGIPGLLWVEQGRAGELAEAAQHAREPLQQALQAPAVSNPLHQAAVQLAASEGDRLLTQWQAERRRSLTDTGRPRGELAEAQAQQRQLQDELAQVQALLGSYAVDVDTLAQLTQALQADEAERPWEPLQQQLGEARQVQQQIAAWTQRQGELQQASASASQHLRWLRAQLQQAQQQRAHLAQRQAHAAQLHTQAQAAEATRAQADAALAQAQTAAQASQARVQAAQQAHHRALHQAHAQRVQAERQRLAQACEAAQAAQAQLQQGEVAWRTQAVPEPALRELQDAHRQQERLRAQLEVARTGLSWSLGDQHGVVLQVGEQVLPLQGTGQMGLTQAARIVLPGGGELRVSPGGARDVQQLQDQLTQIEARQAQALAALGLADWSALQARVQAAQQAQHALALARQQVRTLAPQGLAALQAQRDEAEQRWQQLRQDLEPAAERGDAAPGAPEPSLDPEAAEQALSQAQALAGQQAARLAQAQRQAQAATQAALRVGAELQAVQAECARLQGAADEAAQEAEGAPDPAEQVQQLSEQLATLETQRSAIATQLAAARPAEVAHAVARLSHAVAQLMAQHDERKVQRRLLVQKLQQANGHMADEGLDERAQRLAAELARTERRVRELDGRSQALDLLCRLATQHRQAALARFASPLFLRMQAYVPWVWPQAQVHLGDGLLPQSLHRGAADLLGMPVDKLSVGARDQLALISRLAYADLLKAAGRPTLIVLDDALVHADAERLAAMQRVLREAARRHQVLVFTCHRERWEGLAAAQFWLPDLKAGAPDT
ncbi:hypothetical protein CCO03_16000 [Comamonas serinivorans]|uniref:YhaN AAA domain-containing protein n=1 Tax=Comamonas serinivorans TaxID=1082851 RepID=A0A1Y0ERC2_9BURK|nr:ATP-binding protein [Comamonas serinivorans]ARU05970.1 hypothetical protein CCO03_16000 [Comamonas serinivorans]